MTVMPSIKDVLATMMAPMAWISGVWSERLGRLWVLAQMRSRVPGVDASNVILGLPEMHGGRNIRLGRKLFLYPEIYLETQEAGEIVIGDEVVISRGVHIVSFSGVRIGRGSLIGEYTSIRDANHRYGPGLEPRHSGHSSRPIEIGERVWIGRGVTILPGVTIGDGAVVGANAVVTRDVPPMAVVGGIPARDLNKKSGG